MICDSCHGTGWIRGVEWPEHCATCKGSGKLSTNAVAQALGIAPSTLRRIQKGNRCRRKTYERVLAAITDATQ